MRVRTVETNNPPITAKAIGDLNSEPSPELTAMGSIPNMAVAVVNKIARNLVTPPCISASSLLKPCALS